MRTRTSVESIDRAAKTVRVRDLADGREYEEPYDKLILAPGAAPLRPPIPGIDLPGIFTLRNLQDVDRIKAVVDRGVQKRGGRWRRLHRPGAGGEPRPARRRDHGRRAPGPGAAAVRPGDDARRSPSTLAAQGVGLLLGQSAEAFEPAADGLVVRLKSGERLTAELVILGIGVRPENRLAVAAGLEVGPRGGIRVNEHMRTSDPDIYAVGDAIEVKDFVTGEPTQVPLAGPANRQGRIAADHIFGRDSRYRGTQGTAIVRVFELHGRDDRARPRRPCSARAGPTARSTSTRPSTPATTPARRR